MRKLLVAVAAAVSLAPAASRAQLELGARTGYAFPSGEVLEVPGGADMADLVAGQVPVQLDAGWRFGRHLSAGLSFAYGFGVLGAPVEASCTAEFDCAMSAVRTGVYAAWSFLPAGRFDPWAGLGAGYEWLLYSRNLGGAATRTTRSGWQFLDLSAGVDWNASGSFAVGPFASYSLGQYRQESLEYPDGSVTSVAIENTALHGWLFLGVRGRFRF